MFEIGRLCMKIAGRDAGKKCLIVDVIDEHFVMIDGQTRRRKCNIKHLEPLNSKLEISKNAPAPEIVRILKSIGIEVEEKKPKTKSRAKTEKPKRTRKKKEKPVKATKLAAKTKKAEKTKAEEREKSAEEKIA